MTFMRQSKLFRETLRETPKDAKALNHIFLVRGGFVDQLMSGVYSFQPLGFRVLKKIEQVIREELDKVGAQEVLMPILHPAEIWKKTGRWQEVGKELWRIKSYQGQEIALSMTHEEAITEITGRFIKSASDMPLLLNQFQTKIRDEERPRAGLIRLKEFIMQDAYSFDVSDKESDRAYERVFGAYEKIFKKLGLKVKAQKADSGIMGGNLSHEFKMLSSAGEDMLDGKPAIELGHTFKLGTKYSKAFNMYFERKNGTKDLVVMGSYGIGLNRVMAAAVEAHHDEKGIIWPQALAPFQAHLVALGKKGDLVKKEADKIYNNLIKSGVEVLYDDRDEKTAGEKFADADLIGIPWRVLVSSKTVQSDSVELKPRSSKKTELVKTFRLKSFKF